MPKASLFQKSLAKGYNMYSDDVGKALIHMGVIGWTFSALAQVVMIAKNDKISKKDKKFLIPQEIADGVVNVGLYYTICQGLKKYSDKLCETGKIISESTDRLIAKVQGDNQSAINYLNGINEKFRRIKLANVKNKSSFTSVFLEKTLEELEKVTYTKVKKKVNLDKNNIVIIDKKLVQTAKAKNLLIEEFKKVQSEFKINKNAIGVIATIGGSVLACNLITPICRNLVANQFQKKHITNNITQKAYKIPLPATFNTFKM